MKIFILEDNLAISQLVLLLLKRKGYDAHAFHDINSLLKALDRTTPDFFVLDMMLPDGNGADLAKEFKSLEGLKNIPILMMSASVDNIVESGELHKVDYISKPFDINDFVNRMEKLFEC
ncbi:response regulator [Flavobacterium sp. NRK F10]|uniref:Response regulator n=1 Tax=Flavobacterium sediminis TaxID=2201181 RepID=A0A2U8QW07_9FLAO|nr:MULTISPECIES: response regulator [Flavobacterium]AWM14377.1 response regulator [Flavobacterium sediminis]MCO6175598.1 response regulator [Flavobacterium sp. NRK F10]